MHSFARNVTRPRSPGPAPTRKPFPGFVLLAIASLVSGGSAAPSGDVRLMRLRRHYFSIEQGTARSTSFIESPSTISRLAVPHFRSALRRILRGATPLRVRKFARAISFLRSPFPPKLQPATGNHTATTAAIRALLASRAACRDRRLDRQCPSSFHHCANSGAQGRPAPPQEKKIRPKEPPRKIAGPRS